MALSSAGHGEGEERDVARPLDGERHLALVARAVAADAARDDLATLADEVLERLRILVVDGRRLVRAELADALLAAATAARRVRIEIGRSPEVLVIVEHGRVGGTHHHGSVSLSAFGGRLALRLLVHLVVELVLFAFGARHAARRVGAQVD